MNYEKEFYAEVIINKALDEIDKVFYYRIPQNLIKNAKIGHVVLVPFGQQKRMTGIIVGLVQEVQRENIKEISEVLYPDPIFDVQMLALATWMSEYYMCPKASIYRAMLPQSIGLAGKRKKAKEQICVFPGELFAEGFRKQTRHSQVLRHIEEYPGCLLTEINNRFGIARSTLKRFEEKGYLSLRYLPIDRLVTTGEKLEFRIPDLLTEEQEIVMQKLKVQIHNSKTFLLHGITGSGKTEIYLRQTQKMIAQNKQTIILIPEIALTPQIVGIFKKRLQEKVAVLHSSLSAGEKRDAWLAIAAGKIKVVVGARSAVFAPCRNLGLIIMDEEHEFSYKQDTMPRFHTREVAQKRAELAGASLILGSATPSLESMYRAELGDYKYLQMKKRVGFYQLPQVSIIDMRQELKNGNRDVLGKELQLNIEERLLRKEQTLLFLNRRGHNSFVSCRDCGHVIGCPNCEISLTYHSKGELLKCHYCDYCEPVPVVCPECGSRRIKYFGLGTQKLEEFLQKRYPKARVLRIDADTTQKKGMFESYYQKILKKEVDIILGTQMLAKGLDFPDITLVGVVAADLSLNFPDFRAGERTFQLLAQVAGRAGRGRNPGKVFFQTYLPDDPIIKMAATQDYFQFYQQEIAKRKLMCYPPQNKMIRIVFRGKKQTQVRRVAYEMKDAFIPDDTIKVLGPNPAPLEKIRDNYRYHLILQGDEMSALQNMIKKARGKVDFDKQDVQLQIDVEPLNMM